MYNPEITNIMERELTSLGITPLKTAKEVESELTKPGSSLLVINSVCGCAAGTLRPGMQLALNNPNIPDKRFTVFAGVDLEATEKARSFLQNEPSSPNIILLKDGKPKFVLERKHILGLDAEELSKNLNEAFNKFL